MPIRKPKPTSPGRRFLMYPDFAEVTRTESAKLLTEGRKKSGGRVADGRKRRPARAVVASVASRGTRRHAQRSQIKGELRLPMTGSWAEAAH